MNHATFYKKNAKKCKTTESPYALLVFSWGGPGEWRGTRAGGGPGVWGGAGAVRSSDLSCVCVCAEVGSKHRAKMFLQWPLGFVSGLMGF